METILRAELFPAKYGKRPESQFLLFWLSEGLMPLPWLVQQQGVAGLTVTYQALCNLWHRQIVKFYFETDVCQVTLVRSQIPCTYLYF